MLNPDPFVEVLFKHIEVKADHPITVLNPDEWFTPIQMRIDDGKIWIIGANTCWFNLLKCEIRNKV